MQSAKYILILLLMSSCFSKNTKSDRSIAKDSSKFSILTFNMWLGGEAENQSLERSIEVIRASGAGIVGLQETYGYNPDGSSHDNASIIADSLGWSYVNQGGFGIISEFPVVQESPGKRGVKLGLGNNRFVWFFNCHLNYIPYQPYQLAKIKYGEFPFIDEESEAVLYADSARGEEIKEYIMEIEGVLPEGWPVFLTGDFNEPSFQDWTPEAAGNGLCQLKVEWPATRAVADAGMKDAYRTFYPDEVKNPGKTWSSINTPGEIHDRIDFIFFAGNQLEVKGANTIGPPDGLSGIGILNYPSDHRAVCVKFEWK